LLQAFRNLYKRRLPENSEVSNPASQQPGKLGNLEKCKTSNPKNQQPEKPATRKTSNPGKPGKMANRETEKTGERKKSAKKQICRWGRQNKNGGLNISDPSRNHSKKA